MNAHAPQIRKDRAGSTADAAPRPGRGHAPAARTPGPPSAPAVPAQLREIANRGPQVAQLRAYQERAAGNPQARHVAQLRALVNQRPGVVPAAPWVRRDTAPGGGPDARGIGRADANGVAAPVQRKVTIKGREVESVVDLLAEEGWNTMLSDQDVTAAGWMLGLDHTWDFSDREDLLLFVNRVSSMTGLVGSLFTNGILSRELLHERELPFVGSEDVGRKGDIAVNVLDRRGGKQSALDIASESMTAENRGSISVALERENDWVKNSPDEEKLTGEWTRPEDVALTKEEAEKADRAGGEYGPMVARRYQQLRATARNQQLLNGLYRPEMTRRAQDTLMAIIPRPGKQVANSEPGDGSYESNIPGGKIAPGEGGFTTLLIPRWFQPFYLMLKNIQPEGLDVRFVGDKKVTANYKSPLGHIPVTVDAPDYAGEVATELDRFDVLATHILTA